MLSFILAACILAMVLVYVRRVGNGGPGMSSATATKPPLGFRIRSWLGDNALRFYAVIAFIYLLLPVAYTFAFSFNNAGRTNLVWNSFTLDNWLNPVAPQVCPSVVNRSRSH